MKITALLENTSHTDGMLTEHGLSLYIETGECNILFDMGQTDAFYENAKTLGIDLSGVDIAVLSHGHYDHGGGLAKFLEINSRAKVYMRKDAFLPYYNAKGKYIGLDTELLTEKRIVFTDNGADEYSITDGITLFSCNSRKRYHSFGAFGLTRKAGEELIPDDFRHEHYLQIEGEKCVVISGCSHNGILDITRWFAPDVLIGGFHLSKMPLGTELEDIAKKLSEQDTLYYTCHCTGTEQYEYMKKHMQNLRYLSCGDSIEI